MLKPGLKSCLICAALFLAAVRADASSFGQDPAQFDELEDEVETLNDMGFRVIPLHEAAERVAARFRGRLIAAHLRPPTPDERAHGVDLVHELRLLTPDRDVLLIRLDARTGDFLEVRGAGLTEARRRHEDRK